jgi:uncharacterized protein YndB with AHSA1/START domain
MENTTISSFNKALDLVIERQVDAPKELVWRALVEPELVKQWFAPKPWQTVDCRIDLRVGGEFYTVMHGPEGEKHEGASCFLEIVPQERLIWTAALQPGLRPAAPVAENDTSCAAIIFTCVITLKAKDGGTQYTVSVLHGSPQQTKIHEEMGFYDGWGTCVTQLIDVVKAL